MHAKLSNLKKKMFQPIRVKVTCMRVLLCYFDSTILETTLKCIYILGLIEKYFCLSMGICSFTDCLSVVEGTRKFTIISHTDKHISSFPLALVLQNERLISQILSQGIVELLK